MKLAIENDPSELVIGRIPPKRISSIKIKYEDKLTIKGLFKLRIKRTDAIRWTLSGFGYHHGVVLRILSNVSKKAKRIRQFDFKLERRNGKITDVGVKYLAKILKGLTSLRTLVIDFNSSSRLSDTGLVDLSKALKGLDSLQNLKFDLFYCEKGENNGIENFSKGLRRLTRLRNLDLNLSTFDSGDQELDPDYAMLLYGGYPGQTPEGLGDAGLKWLGKSFKDLGLLENLRVNLKESKLSDTGIKYIAENLKNMELLQSLYFSFQDCKEIEGFGMKYLGENLKELEFLEKVELNFDGCDETIPWSLKDFSDHFQEFKALENIILILPENSIIDGGISNLSHGLHNLGSLKEITLKVDGTVHISNVEFQSLGELLEGLQSIEKIFLDISVTDKGEGGLVVSLRSIGAALRKLESLQEIHLVFSGMRIEDEGLYYLAESLKKVESLKKIELDFEK